MGCGCNPTGATLPHIPGRERAVELFAQINELMGQIARNDYLTIKEKANKLIDEYNGIDINAKTHLVPQFDRYPV